MSMFCFQCQEAANGEGCTVSGMCGKAPETAALQDALMHVARGVAIYAHALNNESSNSPEIQSPCYRWLRIALFTTITNANFDNLKIESQIYRGLSHRLSLQDQCNELGITLPTELRSFASWNPSNREEMIAAQAEIGVLRTGDIDSRSLRELLTYGLKGFAAYLHHAAELGEESAVLNAYLVRGLVATVDSQVDNTTLTALVLETGAKGFAAMALLDTANTNLYGHPELTQVSIGVGERPGILVSGHDLADLEALLIQSEDAGIDVNTGKVDLGVLQGRPRSEVSKMQLFMDVMKSLEGEHKSPVEEKQLVEELAKTEKFTEEEAKNFIRKMARDSSIYESKPGHYNIV